MINQLPPHLQTSTNALIIPVQTGLNVLTQRADSNVNAQRDIRMLARQMESAWTSTSAAAAMHVVLTRNALTCQDLINVSVRPDSPEKAIQYAKVCV